MTIEAFIQEFSSNILSFVTSSKNLNFLDYVENEGETNRDERFHFFPLIFQLQWGRKKSNEAFPMKHLIYFFIFAVCSESGKNRKRSTYRYERNWKCDSFSRSQSHYFLSLWDIKGTRPTFITRYNFLEITRIFITPRIFPSFPNRAQRSIRKLLQSSNLNWERGFKHSNRSSGKFSSGLSTLYRIWKCLSTPAF